MSDKNSLNSEVDQYKRAMESPNYEIFSIKDENEKIIKIKILFKDGTWFTIDGEKMALVAGNKFPACFGMS